MRIVRLLGKGRSVGIDPPLPPGAEQWGLNDLTYVRYGGRFNAWSRWIDPHSIEHIRTRRPETYAWYQRQDGRRPIVLAEFDPSIPGCEVYPFQATQEAWGGETFFTSSLDWMIARGVLEGFEVIELLWFRELPFRQLMGAHYWVGRARSRGVQVVIHGDSAICRPGRLYGVEGVE